jgi:single stranded DNA-binding protein
MINGTLIGHVGGSPELRETRTGKKVAVLNIALNNRYTGETTWYKVEAWNGLGEKVVMPYVKKGHQIAVTIRDLRLETWNAKESGEARGMMVVTADQIELLSNGRDTRHASDSDDHSSPPPGDADDMPF